MRRTNDLEQRLAEWGKEYGGGKYEDNGWQGVSPLAMMIRYQGRAPQGLNPRSTKELTPADRVERIVIALGRAKGGWSLSQVIRMEYTHPGEPWESKGQLLRSIGLSMGRSTYYRYLKQARDHVSMELGMRAEEVA